MLNTQKNKPNPTAVMQAVEARNAIAITILVIQSKTYYVNYYEKGMIVSTLFKKTRFTYNDIIDIKNQANVTISNFV
ncbi:MAG: hypothetical protein Q4D54_00295 [Eubacteriales bacterium]|nr:hypothetical protein [Eubacteriales bacterium]